MNEEISSDTVLAILGLFRERLPCSENFWRYKRNYDLHMKIVQPQGAGSVRDGDSQSVMSAGSSTTKRIASPKMRHVRALSPYSKWQAQGEMGLHEQKSMLSSYIRGSSDQVAPSDKGQKNEGQTIGDQRASFQEKLEQIRSMQQKKKDESA